MHEFLPTPTPQKKKTYIIDMVSVIWFSILLFLVLKETTEWR